MNFSSNASLISESVSSSSFTFNYPCNSQDNCEPIKVSLKKGKFLFELWGAAASTSSLNAGNGSYTRGVLPVIEDLDVYIYIGASASQGYLITFNGGYSQSPGGGATDVRLQPGEWNDFDSLKTRIMVASGGGGADGMPARNGEALGSTTSSGVNIGGSANQTSGGDGAFPGLFGIGGGHQEIPTDGCGAGGGGYYGGGSSSYSLWGSGGGGSSFISGHPGCDAIKQESTYNNIIHTGKPVHFSGYYFVDTKMISGSDRMPSLKAEFEIGHRDNGAARITDVTYLFPLAPCSPKYRLNNIFFIYVSFVQLSLII